jgi:hypothetical protein
LLDLRTVVRGNSVAAVTYRYSQWKYVMPLRDSPRLRRKQRAFVFVALSALGGALPCHADAITEWDAKASAVASPAALGERELAIVDLAMFDAVNSIARQYQPYLVREDGFGGASAEAAAASAAATALEKLHPQMAADFKSALDDY